MTARYRAILADPPWSFRTWGGKAGTPHRCAADHYDVMDERSLAALPVADWAADDCALFMWVVSSHMAQAIDLGRAWGFEPKSLAFVWVKTREAETPPGLSLTPLTRMGMGYWTRQEAEICLLMTRGNIGPAARDVRQVIFEPRREHSRKPDCVHDRIARLVDGPYLEMFARQRRPGWGAWGNQTDKFMMGA